MKLIPLLIIASSFFSLNAQAELQRNQVWINSVKAIPYNKELYTKEDVIAKACPWLQDGLEAGNYHVEITALSPKSDNSSFKTDNGKAIINRFGNAKTMIKNLRKKKDPVTEFVVDLQPNTKALFFEVEYYENESIKFNAIGLSNGAFLGNMQGFDNGITLKAGMDLAICLKKGTSVNLIAVHALTPNFRGDSRPRVQVGKGTLKPSAPIKDTPTLHTLD